MYILVISTLQQFKFVNVSVVSVNLYNTITRLAMIHIQLMIISILVQLAVN